jgi:hypothetical protein
MTSSTLIYCYYYLSRCVRLSSFLAMPSLLAGDICSKQPTSNFDNASLGFPPRSRTVFTRLAAGISNSDGIAALLLYLAFRHNSQIAAVKGRVVLADGVSWRRR